MKKNQKNTELDSEYEQALRKEKNRKIALNGLKTVAVITIVAGVGYLIIKNNELNELIVEKDDLLSQKDIEIDNKNFQLKSYETLLIEKDEEIGNLTENNNALWKQYINTLSQGLSKGRSFSSKKMNELKIAK